MSWRPDSEWSGWIGYTWSRVRDRIDGEDIPRSWGQEHAVNAGLSWTRGPWALTVADTWHTGRPTTRIDLQDSGGAVPEVILGERNAARHASYNSLDYRLTRTFRLSRGELDAFIEASNLTSRDNPCCTVYEVRTDGTRYWLEADPKSWLSLVPSIGVLWRY